MRVTLLLLSLICFLSCKGRKYEMVDVIDGNELVDVTEFIINRHFEPIYCRTNTKEICALRNPHPQVLSENWRTVLSARLSDWVTKQRFPVSPDSLAYLPVEKYSRYEYSYLVGGKMVDVYKTSIIVSNDSINAYFRLWDGNMFGEFDDDGWVIQ